MSLINSKNKSFAISSNQVLYDGKLTKYFKEKTECLDKEDDILFLVMQEIDLIKKQNYLYHNDIKVINEKLNNIIKTIANIENKINNINASNINVTIDLDCLESNSNNCCSGNIKTYPISTILNLFKKEICILKN